MGNWQYATEKMTDILPILVCPLPFGSLIGTEFEQSSLITYHENEYHLRIVYPLLLKLQKN